MHPSIVAAVVLGSYCAVGALVAAVGLAFIIIEHIILPQRRKLDWRLWARYLQLWMVLLVLCMLLWPVCAYLRSRSVLLFNVCFRPQLKGWTLSCGTRKAAMCRKQLGLSPYDFEIGIGGVALVLAGKRETAETSGNVHISVKEWTDDTCRKPCPHPFMEGNTDAAAGDTVLGDLEREQPGNHKAASISSSWTCVSVTDPPAAVLAGSEKLDGLGLR